MPSPKPAPCRGSPEMITYSLADYEALALKLARDKNMLAAIKSKL